MKTKTKTKTIDLKEKLIRIVEKMEQNTFLLPEGWGERIQMSKKQEAYRTYCGSRGIGRYICFEYQFENGEQFRVDFRNDDIRVESLDIFKPISNLKKKVEYIINSIYEEKHSFIENAEGINKIRSEIAQCKKYISENKDKIKTLEKQIKDYLLLKK